MVAEKTGIGFINQRDMGLTLFSLFGYTIVHPDFFKVPIDTEGFLALCHVWRVIGHLLGIADEFNVFQGDVNLIQKRSRAFLNHIITPTFMNLPKNFEHMSFALMDGLRSIIPEINVPIMRFFSNVLNNVPGYYLKEESRLYQIKYVKRFPHYVAEDTDKVIQVQKDIDENVEVCSAFGKLSLFQRCNIRFTAFLVGDIGGKSNILRRISNLISKERLYFMLKYPIIAKWRFGEEYAYVDNSIMESYLKAKRGE